MSIGSKLFIRSRWAGGLLLAGLLAWPVQAMAAKSFTQKELRQRQKAIRGLLLGIEDGPVRVTKAQQVKISKAGRRWSALIFTRVPPGAHNDGGGSWQKIFGTYSAKGGPKVTRYGELINKQAPKEKTYNHLEDIPGWWD